MKLLSGLLFLSLVFYSCSDNSSAPDTVGSIFGIWVLDSYENDNLVMIKSSGFDENKEGFRIDADGIFVDHKINGWCGTPPLVYQDYKGIWIPESETILRITVGYWGGMEVQKMQLISVSSSGLVIKYISREPL